MITVKELVPTKLNFDHIEKWLSFLAKKENRTLGDLAFIIGSDEWLLDINRTYLKHDFYTDVITFDYCEADVLSGDIFISLDRVFDNASKFNVSRETELNRVLIHGVLHLVGYNDKSEEEIAVMRNKETFYLNHL